MLFQPWYQKLYQQDTLVYVYNGQVISQLALKIILFQFKAMAVTCIWLSSPISWPEATENIAVIPWDHEMCIYHYGDNFTDDILYNFKIDKKHYNFWLYWPEINLPAIKNMISTLTGIQILTASTSVLVLWTRHFKKVVWFTGLLLSLVCIKSFWWWSYGYQYNNINFNGHHSL